jgi:hypothetical protein
MKVFCERLFLAHYKRHAASLGGMPVASATHMLEKRITFLPDWLVVVDKAIVTRDIQDDPRHRRAWTTAEITRDDFIARRRG